MITYNRSRDQGQRYRKGAYVFLGSWGSWVSFILVLVASLSLGETVNDKIMASSDSLAVSEFGMKIPSSHPKIWWNEARLERAKRWYKSHSFIPKSDDYLDQAFLYLLTKRPDYCQNPVKHAMAVKVDTSKVSSDAARWEGENVILTYDWCYDQFTELQRATLIQNWNRWLTALMQKPWGGPAMPESNYFWGYLRNELEWGIATYAENTTAANSFLQDALITRWQQAFKAHALTNGFGGVPQEGTQYGRYLIRYPLLPFITASLLGRDIYDESDFFKDAIFFLIYSTTPAPTALISSPSTESYELFPFNDDEFYRQGGSARASAFGDFMVTAANVWAGNALGQYARAWVNMVHPSEAPYVAALDLGGPAASLKSLPLDYYAPGPQYLYARSSWQPSATAVMLQMGRAFGVGHTHLDYGSWQICREGHWLSRESTGYSEPFTGYSGVGSADASSTLAHNGLLINGVGFPIGAVNGPPTVRRLESRPAYTYADVDLSTSYSNNLASPSHPERDNPAARHVEREFIFIRSLETLIVFDRLQSNAAGGKGADQIVKTFLAHFEERPTIQDSSHVIAKNGNQSLRLTTLLPSNVTYRVIDEKIAGSKVGQYRLEVDSSGADQTYFLTVLQARDRTRKCLDPTVSDTGDSFSVRLGQHEGVDVLLMINKGMMSSGGLISIGDQQYTFLDGVQQLTVKDQGPIWQQ